MRIFLTITLLVTLVCSPLLAAETKTVRDQNGNAKRIAADEKGVFTAVLENDYFTGSDLGYTNGVRFAYTSPEEQMPNFIRQASTYLPLLNAEGEKRISVSLGQNIYTPSDISKREFLPNDFLYAGWLYGSLGIISDSGERFDNVMLTLGMVGPASRSEQTQKFIHKVKGSTKPEGWDHQLKDEPGINFAYERKWREIFATELFGLGFDIMPHVGANLGNINTSASTGATFRFGVDLPADYGPPRIRPTISGSDFFIPTKRLSGYLFSTIEARAVARDIFLDGNTFKDSPSLDKRTMVKNLQLGGTVIYKDMRLSYTHVILTKQFKGQREHYTQFGGITFSYRF